MAVKSKSIVTIVLIAIIAVVILCIGYGSYLFGKKTEAERYRQGLVQTDVTLDSLHCIELSLRDSLKNVEAQRSELTIIREVFKTYYDTVQIKSVSAQIVDGLNFIISTPIPPKQ